QSGRSGGEVGGRAGEVDVVGGGVGDGEGEQRAGRDGAAGALEGDRAGGGAGEDMCGVAGRGHLVGGPTAVTGAGVVGEVDDEGGVRHGRHLLAFPTRRSSDLQSGRSGGEVGGRAGEVDVVGGGVGDGEGEQRAGRDGAAGALEGDRAGGGAGEGLRGDAGSGGVGDEATEGISARDLSVGYAVCGVRT